MLANTLPLIIATIALSLASINIMAAQPATSLPETLVTQFESHINYITLEAKLEAVKQSTVSAQTSGIIEMINFDINDKVEAGQVLILINSSQQQAALSQAEAAQAQAQALNKDAQVVLKRHRALLAQKTLSQGEFDTSLARANSAHAMLLAAKAQVTQAQEQLSYTRMTAPYSGIVRERFVQMGELVNPGQPVMTGFALKPLRAVTDIPQSLAAQITQQSTAQSEPIHILAHGKRYQGTELTLFPYADSRYSSIRARINFVEEIAGDSSTLIPGTWVQVQFPSNQQHGIYLPASAILQQGEVASVYVKKETGYSLRYVRLGQTLRDNRVRIISGLEADEEIAIDALAAVRASAGAAAVMAEKP